METEHKRQEERLQALNEVRDLSFLLIFACEPIPNWYFACDFRSG
jgi:hypothetical protein